MTDLNRDEALLFWKKKIKMADSKNLSFSTTTNSQYFFAKISGIGFWVSPINWCKGHWFCSTSKLSKAKFSRLENLALLSLYIHWGKCVYFSFFEWLNLRLCQTNIIVNFIIQELKNKHTFPQKYTNWAKLSSLNLTEREETKNKYFAPKSILYAPR